MPEAIPLYLLTPPDGLSDALRERLAPLGRAREVGSVDELLGPSPEGAPPEPGWILLTPGTPASVVLDLLVRLAEEGADWSPIALAEEGESVFVFPIHPGFRERVEEAAPSFDGSRPRGVLSFRFLLKDLARIRHDLNNPLTAALAETQLVLMDVEPGSEVERSLQVVEAQLRRIRDMVAQLSPFRAPVR